MVGNLKLEVTKYSRGMYGPRKLAHLSGGDDDGDNDDDDDGGDGGDDEDSKVTLSYWSRKRWHH